MEALRPASALPRIEQTARRAAQAPTDRVGLDAAARDVAALSSAPRSPVEGAIGDLVRDVSTYAGKTLARFPSAGTAALAQAMGDVGLLAALGTGGNAITASAVRSAARTMLTQARDRAQKDPDYNSNVATVSQGLQDARRAMSLESGDAVNLVLPGLLARMTDRANIQQSVENRVNILSTGAKILTGLLTVQPQIVERGGPVPTLPASVMSLPPQRRAEFLDLWSRFDRASVRINRRYENDRVAVQEALARLADSAALDARDANGDDLLSNLTQLSRQPIAIGLDRDLILAQTIAHVAYPGRTMSQGVKLTCAAATVSYQLAHRRPAEYARLVCGLTWPEGQVRLASGTILRRLPDALQEDGGGRTVVERLVQSSLMEAGGSVRRGHYENLGDGFFDGTGQLVQTGMYPTELAKLEGAVGEGRFEGVDAPSREELVGLMGQGDLPVALHWEGREDHWVLARGVREGRVYFRNPHGFRNTDRITLSGVDHRLHPDGIESLPIEEFAGRAKHALRRVGQ
jgi:hypothetical protein